MEKSRHLKTATIPVVHVDQDFGPGPFKQENIQSEATMIIAVPSPHAGCIVVGQQSISYHRS